jgi:hypothetical protein
MTCGVTLPWAMTACGAASSAPAAITALSMFCVVSSVQPRGLKKRADPRVGPK